MIIPKLVHIAMGMQSAQREGTNQPKDADTEINLPQALEQDPQLAPLKGSVVSQVKPDGTVVVAGPNGGHEINVSDYVKSLGLDPMKTRVQYNSPESALSDNAIGFKDGVSMALADEKHQEQFLRGKFGEGNVQKTDNGFVVNENGVWKNANPSFLSSVASNSPEVAGAGVGGEAGAMIGATIGGIGGSFFGPAGTFGGIAAGTTVGSFLGSAIGGAAAHIYKNKGLEALNMRTEADGKAADGELSKEIVNNMIWQAVLPPVVGAAVGVGKAVGGTAARIGNVVSKDGLAWLGKFLMNGTKYEDWRTVVNSSEDANTVVKGIQKMRAWMTGSKEGADPMTQEMTTNLNNFMTKAKVSAEKIYGDGLDEIKSVTNNEKIVDTRQAVANLRKSLAGLGVLAQDAKGNWVVDPKAAIKNGEIQQLFDQGGMNALNSILRQGQAFEGEVSFDAARALKKGARSAADSVSLPQGAQISDDVQKIVAAYQQDMSEAVKKGLINKTIVKDGVQRNAAQAFSELDGKYSAYRDVYTKWAKESAAGGNINQQSSFLERLIGPKGDALEEQFQKLANATDLEWRPMLRQLQQQRAAKNLADSYSPAGTGLLKFTSQTLSGGPEAYAQRMAKFTNWKEGWQDGVTSKMLIQPTTKAVVGAKAIALDAWQNMSPEAKQHLLTNPTAIKYFGESIAKAPQMQQGIFQQMMQSATNQAQQPPQQ